MNGVSSPQSKRSSSALSPFSESACSTANMQKWLKPCKPGKNTPFFWPARYESNKPGRDHLPGSPRKSGRSSSLLNAVLLIFLKSRFAGQKFITRQGGLPVESRWLERRFESESTSAAVSRLYRS